MIKAYKKLKEKKGITLVALVVTIIVLIILVGVTINLILGDNGVITRAKTAKEQYQNAQDYEETEIAKYSNEIERYVGGTRSDITLTKLYETSSPSSTMSLSESYKNYTFLCFAHTDQSSFSGIRVDYMPVIVLSELQNKNKKFALDGYYDNYADIDIVSDTQFKVDSGNEKIYYIYGI